MRGAGGAAAARGLDVDVGHLEDPLGADSRASRCPGPEITHWQSGTGTRGASCESAPAEDRWERFREFRPSPLQLMLV